jgi:hypothetical protein
MHCFVLFLSLPLSLSLSMCVVCVLCGMYVCMCTRLCLELYSHLIKRRVMCIVDRFHCWWVCTKLDNYWYARTTTDVAVGIAHRAQQTCYRARHRLRTELSVRATPLQWAWFVIAEELSAAAVAWWAYGTALVGGAV